MVAPRVQASPWAARRRRAEALRARHAFAGEVLGLYVALLDVWEQSFMAVRSEQPPDLGAWAADRVLPSVVAATAEFGPKPLVESVLPLADLSGAADLMAAWLAGEELVPVERYLARAALRGPLQAVDASVACAADPSPRGGRRCPRCGGPPQLSFRTDTGDHLVSGRRQLQCARCPETWNYSASACAYCDETADARRTVYTERRAGTRVGRGEPGDVVPLSRDGRPRRDRAGEPQARAADGGSEVGGARDGGPQAGRAGDGGPTFPHLRIEACTTCRRYLIDVDLGRDPAAVPEVDELAALPLDLYAAEHGLLKITPNVMGF